MNGAELAKFGKQIGDIVLGEEAVKKQHERESKSIWAKFAGKDSNDFESFMQLEKLKEQKKELESIMRLYGRPGLYQDWVKYCGEQRKSRRMAELEAAARREQIMEYIGYLAIAILLIVGLIGLIWFVLALRNG